MEGVVDRFIQRGQVSNRIEANVDNRPKLKKKPSSFREEGFFFLSGRPEWH